MRLYALVGAGDPEAIDVFLEIGRGNGSTGSCSRPLIQQALGDVGELDEHAGLGHMSTETNLRS